MNLKKLSRQLSYVLRHKPESVGLTLDSGGWADVASLLLAFQSDLPTLRRIVVEDNKGRYVFSEDETKIRATQGHSIPVNLGLATVKPPDLLFHGTAYSNHLPILQQGIQKMSRQYVHLSTDFTTANKVGERHGKPVVFHVDSKEMHNHGFLFYLSENGVWLTDFVPPEFIY